MPAKLPSLRWIAAKMIRLGVVIRSGIICSRDTDACDVAIDCAADLLQDSGLPIVDWSDPALSTV